MTLSIQMQSTKQEIDIETFSVLLKHIKDSGYQPLILDAKAKFMEVFSGESGFDAASSALSDTRSVIEHVYRRYPLSRYRRGDQIFIAGDVFFAKKSPGILYVALQFSEIDLRRLKSPMDVKAHLEVGFLGGSDAVGEIEDFVRIISDILSEEDLSLEWVSKHYQSPQFDELSNSDEIQFVPASTIAGEDLKLAGILEDTEVRDLAITIRRAGGILVSDIAKKTKASSLDVQSTIQKLVDAGLLSQEYVVICKKTSNQINRVDSQDKIAEMARLGVRCSCGRLISDERIEELIVPTGNLQQLLNQSYWMTARLVQSLESLHIPNERVLLNLQEGAEEIDAFVDVDGTLLMFELKDNEFSMGHAYPFGGRIGLYKPDYAIIVSTKGVDSDVKSYFKRVQPDATIVYIETLDDLTSQLEDVVAKVRANRVQELIRLFDPMASIETSLSEVLLPRLGIDMPKRRVSTWR